MKKLEVFDNKGEFLYVRFENDAALDEYEKNFGYTTIPINE